MNPDNLGEKCVLSFGEAKEKLTAGQVTIFVDRLRAMQLGGSGLPMGTITNMINWISLMAFLAIIPIWIFTDFRTALTALVIGVIGHRWAKARVVETVRDYALSDEQLFLAFQNDRVIWFREVRR